MFDAHFSNYQKLEELNELVPGEGNARATVTVEFGKYMN